ncbi:MAG: hypothetical protein AAGI71_14315 [Bacteroidota bacterium]
MDNKNQWFARNQEAETYERQGDASRAIALYEANVREGCDLVFTYERLAVLQSKEGRHQKAMEAINRAIELEDRRGPSAKGVRLREHHERIKVQAAKRGPERSATGTRKAVKRARATAPKATTTRKGCLGVVLVLGGVPALLVWLLLG